MALNSKVVVRELDAQHEPEFVYRRHYVRCILGLLVALDVVDYGRVVASVSGRIATQDNTLLWLIARDWGHLHLHQPNIYGQSYGTTVEGIPVELLRRAGGLSPSGWSA